MKSKLIQNPSDYKVHFKVIDRTARRKKEKSIVYELKAEVGVDALPKIIIDSLEDAKKSIRDWEAKPVVV